MYPTRYASFLKRLVAHILDVLIAALLAGMLAIPLGLLLFHGHIFNLAGIFDCGQLNCDLDLESDFGGILESWLGSINYSLIAGWLMLYSVFYWLYFALFESSARQATPGKMMLGIFVTDLSGARISFLRALGRTLAKILSKLFCYLGYILAGVSSRSQALHDLLVGTLVLEPAYPAPPVSPYVPDPSAQPSDQPGGPAPQEKAAEPTKDK